MKIAHVTSLYVPDNTATRHRFAVAAETWDIVYRAYPGQIVPRHQPMELASRTSRDLGDSRGLPFVKDLVAFAFAPGPDGAAEAVMLTNADTCLIPSRLPWMLEALQWHGCFYSHRIDHPHLPAPLPDEQASRGQAYAGADLFAFTRDWWSANAEDYPDLLFGAEAWDGVLKQMMRRCGFETGPPIVYHERHEAFWRQHLLTNPAQKHNRTLAEQWIRRHGEADFLCRPTPAVLGAGGAVWGGVWFGDSQWPKR